MPIEIPCKSTFKLDEICSMLDLRPYVVRFWESQFEQITPVLSSTGQKLYSHSDIEVMAYVKKLLYEDKLSVEKVKAILRSRSQSLVEGEQVEQMAPQVTAKSLGPNSIKKLERAKELLNKILDHIQEKTIIKM